MKSSETPYQDRSHAAAFASLRYCPCTVQNSDVMPIGVRAEGAEGAAAPSRLGQSQTKIEKK